MNMYEVVMDLEESDVYNISSIVIDRVSNVENLLIHGFTNIYRDWDELVFNLARTCIKLEFEHIVITIDTFYLDKLERVVFRGTEPLESLGRSAFEGCVNLVSVDFKGKTPKSIGEHLCLCLYFSSPTQYQTY